MGDPSLCPIHQPEALVGARRDHCWVLHSWGTLSSCLTEKTAAGTHGAHIWGHACTHVLAPRRWARVHSYGSQQTRPCQSHEPHSHHCLGTGHQSPWTGSLGQSRGLSHLSLPEAGARDSNGAFRLVRASYCR